MIQGWVSMNDISSIRNLINRLSDAQNTIIAMYSHNAIRILVVDGLAIEI